jgi:outer membrane protein TolC
MSKKKRLIGLLCATALCSQGLYAQSQLMGIDELLRLADAQSKSIQTYRTGTEAAGEALKAAKAQRLPDVNVSLSASYLGNGKIWDRDFGNAMTVDMPHFGNNFAIEAQQVIYAGGAISSGIRQAELGKQLAELDLQKDIQKVRFLLLGHYLNLYKLDNHIKVLQDNIRLTDEVIANMKAKREQGTVLKNDITRYELQKEQLNLQLTRARDARTTANFQLVTTLHLPEGTEIKPDTAMLEQKIQTLTENEWQDMARANNILLKQTQTAIRLNEQKVKQERAERLPHISIVAADHLDGPVTIEVPALDNNFNYWYIGVGIKYNLSSLFKNSNRLRQARLNVRQAQENHQLAQEKIKNDVQEGYVNFMTSFTDLRTQEKSLKLADENYNVTDNRYKNGMALLTDMLDASNMKLNAGMELVNARTNILYNYYKMKYITHTL